MKRPLITALIILVCMGSLAHAVRFATTNQFIVPEGETYNEELWLLSDSIDISGVTRDEIFALSATTTLSGILESDVWIAGEQIVFVGEARQHVRFLGKTVRINAAIDKSLMAGANSVALHADSIIKGDATLLGETVLVEGKIRGNVRIIAQSVTINGQIGGNLHILAEDIVIMPNSEIGGNLTYTSSSDLVLDNKVILHGELIKKNVESTQLPKKPKSFNAIVTLQIFFYLCALIVALPFVGIFPRFTGRAVRILRQSMWKSMLVGVIAFCLIPMAAFFAMITVIGMPLSLIMLSLYGILLYLSKVIVALVIGGIILRRRGPQPFMRVFTALSLGLIALYTITALPYVGVSLTLITMITGLGALILAIFSSQTEITIPIPPHFPNETPPLQSNKVESFSSNNETENKQQTKE